MASITDLIWPLMPNSGRCELVYLCAGLYAINGGSDRHIQHCHSYRARLSESGASRRRPPGKGGPIGIARSETAQVLTVASGRSADRSRATAMGRRPAGGRWPWRAGRRGLPGGASSPARQGVTDSPRSLRIFADHLSETAQVTDAGRLTCAGAAGSPSWLRSAGRPLGVPLADTDRDHVLLSRPASVQIFPSPWLSWAAVSLPGRTGTDPGGSLARGRAGTCLPPAGDRPARRPAVPRPPPAGCPSRLGHGVRVVQAGVGGGVTELGTSATCSTSTRR